MSTIFNDKDYLELIKSLSDHQYDDDESVSYDEMEWIPSEPEIKEKLIKHNNGIIDLTNIKSNLIKDEILKCTNIKVGKFKIKIKHYSAVPSQKGSQMSLSLKLFEEKTQTPNGMPCKMDYSFAPYKDTRFDNRPWLKYFNQSSSAFNIPIETVVEIIRWLQALNKMGCFI